MKHTLKIKYYIRYVDDFVILHNNEEQLEIWNSKIDDFLKQKLGLELHQQKSRIITIKRGIGFVGFRHFKRHKLLRKRRIRNIKRKIQRNNLGLFSKEKFLEILQGWNAYASWANSFKLRKKIFSKN